MNLLKQTFEKKNKGGLVFMNKGELIKAVAAKTGLTAKDAGLAYDAIIEAVTETLKNGEKVQLLGFGTIEIKDVAAKTGVNPATGEKVEIAASKKPVMKFGKAYKEIFNK